MIPAIKILPDDVEQLPSSGYHLLVIMGDCDWQFALLNKEKRSAEALLGFHFGKATDEKTFETNWNEVLNAYPFLNKFYSAVTVVYAVAETAIWPGKEMKESDSDIVLNTLFGEKEEVVVKSDMVMADDMRVLYRIPSFVHKTIHRTYINAEDKHYYSRELRALVKSGYEDLLLVNFLGSYFTVSLVKDSKLQLMQLYEYRQPEDVLYYLLTIAKEFDCNREEIALVIGGMVDEKSALFDELKKYFLNISLSLKPEVVDCSKAFEEFPLHYFHSLFTTALCV